MTGGAGARLGAAVCQIYVRPHGSGLVRDCDTSGELLIQLVLDMQPWGSFTRYDSDQYAKQCSLHACHTCMEDG